MSPEDQARIDAARPDPGTLPGENRRTDDHPRMTARAREACRNADAYIAHRAAAEIQKATREAFHLAGPQAFPDAGPPLAPDERETALDALEDAAYAIGRLKLHSDPHLRRTAYGPDGYAHEALDKIREARKTLTP